MASNNSRQNLLKKFKQIFAGLSCNKINELHTDCRKYLLLPKYQQPLTFFYLTYVVEQHKQQQH